jgi:uncharacterized repeat protein (TIGR01451 family)
MRSMSNWTRVWIAVLGLTIAAAGQAAKTEQSTQRARAAWQYGNLPLSFEPNLGQADRRAEFVSRGRGYTLLLNAGETVIGLRHETGPGGAFERRGEGGARRVESTVLHMRLVGADERARATAEQPLPGRSNYFIGNDRRQWRTNIPTYGRVRYRGVYPGIDLVYYGNQRRLEHDFEVAPGADVSSIRLAFDGSRGLRVDKSGDLVVEVAGGEVRLQKPAIYQEGKEGRREVAGGYVLRGQQAGISVGDYDRNRKLVIDPILAYATYLGGSGEDWPYGVAVNSSGEAYIAGLTSSTDFPVGPTGVISTTCKNCGGTWDDVFVTKLNATGSGFAFSTFISGSGDDEAYSVALDGSGNAYVTGYTDSSDFPVTAGAYQSNLNSAAGNAFITEISSDGTQVLWSTYLGGTARDFGNPISVDGNGNVYVAGRSYSRDLPATKAVGSAPVIFMSSLDSGSTWQQAGPTMTSFDVAAIAPDGGTPSTVYAGAVGGVYRTNDGGNTWTQVVTDYVQALVLDATTTGSGARLYYGSRFSGLYRLDNAGSSRVQFSGFGNNWNVLSVALDPNSPMLYAGTNGDGVYASTSATAPNPSVTKVSSGLTDQTINALIIDGNTNRVFAGTRAGVFWMSVGGTTWTPLPTAGLTDLNITSLAVDSAASRLYAASATGGLFRIAAGDTSWTPAGLGTPFLRALAVVPNTSPATIYAGGRLGVSVTTDGGTTWAPKGLPGSNAIHSIAVNPVATTNVYMGANNSVSFVAKFSAAKTPVFVELYPGYDGTLTATSVAFDSTGNLYAAGQTTALTLLAPMVGQTTLGGATDAFVAQFAGNGDVGWDRYLGGTNDEQIVGLRVDPNGNVYGAGLTNSANFPVTAATAYQSALKGSAGGAYDAFVSVIDPTGSTLLWSSYFGGSGADEALGLELTQGPSGGYLVHIAGQTNSPDMPTANAAQPFNAGGWDGFYARFDPTKSGAASLLYATYAGGSYDDFGLAVGVDANGGAYMAGATYSLDFPVTPGAMQTALTGGTGEDGFVAKLQATGNTADLQTSMIAPSSVLAGDTYAYQVTVYNQGTSPSGAQNVRVFDVLPGNVALAGPVNATQGTCNVNGNTITCNVGLLNYPGSVSIYIPVTASVPTPPFITFRNTVFATTSDDDPDTTNNAASVDVTAQAKADVYISGGGSYPATAAPGGPMSFVVNVSNAGPSDAANTMLTTTLAAGALFNPTGSSPGCSVNASTVTCAVGTVGITGPVAVTINEVAPSTTGNISNTFTVSTDDYDPNPGNNSVTWSTNVGNFVDLALSYNTSQAQPVGGTNTINYTVQNFGPSATSNVTFTATMPAGALVIGYSAPTATCTPGATVTCTIPALAAGASEVISVLLSEPVQGTFAIPSSVSGPDQDPNPNNNSVVALVTFNSGMNAQPATLVTDTYDSKVYVLNTYGLNAITPPVTAGPSPNSVVIAANGRLAFVADAPANYVSVLDLTIQQEITRLRGVNASSLAVTGDGRTVVAAGIALDEIGLIDAATFAVQKVSLDGKVGDAAGVDDIGVTSVVAVGKRAYLNTSTAIGVVVVDFTSTPTVAAISGTGTGTPGSDHMIAATPDGAYVIALRGSDMVFISTSTNTVAFTTPVPAYVPQAIAITPDPNAAGGVYGFIGGGLSVNAVDLRNGSGSFGQIVTSGTVAMPFPVYNLALSGDGNVLQSAAMNGELARLDAYNVVNTPAYAISQVSSAGTFTRGITVGYIQTFPTNAPPQVSSVDPATITNEAAKTVLISGDNFAAGAMVRIGNLDPIAATVISPKALQVTVPQGAAVQTAQVIVTLPNTGGDPLSQQVSGYGGQLHIEPPPTFSPHNPVIANTTGSQALSILSVDTALVYGGAGRALAISPDGMFAYWGTGNPPKVGITNLDDGSQPEPVTLQHYPGVTDGIAVAVDPQTGTKAAFFVAGTGSGNMDDTLYLLDVDPASPTRNTVLRTIAANLGNFSDPQGLAVTPDGRYAYSVDTRMDGTVKLVIFDVLNATSSTVATALDVTQLGAGTSQLHIHISPDGQALLLRGADGSIKVYDISGSNWNSPLLKAAITGSGASKPTTFTYFQVVGTSTARLFAYDSAQSFLQAFNFNWSAQDFSPLGNFTITPAAQSLRESPMVVMPDGSLIYAALRDEDAVAVLDAAKVASSDPSSLITKMATAIGPAMLAVSPRSAATADITINLSAMPTSALGQMMTLEASVNNLGPSTATGVAATIPLPAGVTLVSAVVQTEQTYGAMPVPCTGTTTISCPVGTLPNGSYAYIAVVMTPSSTGVYNFGASVAGNEIDPNLGNNNSTASTTVSNGADLQVTATANPASAPLNTQVAITVTVTNQGPDPTTNVQVMFSGSDGLQGGSPVPSQGTCLPSGNYCLLGAIAPGGTVTITGSPTVVAGPSVTLVSQAMDISFPPVPDPDMANNQATLAISVTNPATPVEHLFLVDRSAGQVLAQTGGSSGFTNMKTGVSSNYMAVSPNRHLAFVANQNVGYVSVLDLTIGKEIERIRGLRASTLALTADGSRLIVPLIARDAVAIVDAVTFQTLQTISVNGMVGDGSTVGDITFGAIKVIGQKAFINVNNFPKLLMLDANSYAVSTAQPGGASGGRSYAALAPTPDGLYVLAVRANPPSLLVLNAGNGSVAGTIYGSGNVVAQNTTTLLGTNRLNLDSSSSAPDIWWNQIDAVQRQMTPVNGAGIYNLGTGVVFANLTMADLKTLPYTSTPINGNADATNQLVTGDVFAVHTNDGNYAKVLVTSYGYDIGLQWVTYAGTPVNISSSISITGNASDPNGVWGYVNRGSSISVIDLNPGSPTAGELVGSSAFLSFAPTFTAVSDDGTRLYGVANSFPPGGSSGYVNNFAVLDTSLLRSSPSSSVQSESRVGLRLTSVVSVPSDLLPEANAPVVTDVQPNFMLDDVPTPLRILGSNFATDARVRVGRLGQLPVTFVSPNELRVTIPAGAPLGNEDVVVTNPNLTAPPTGQLLSAAYLGGNAFGDGPGIAIENLAQPKFEVYASNFGDASVGRVEQSHGHAGFTSVPDPLGLAFSPGGTQIYVQEFGASYLGAFASGWGGTTLSFSPTMGQSEGVAVAPDPATGQPVAYVVSSYVNQSGAIDEQLNLIKADPYAPAGNTVIGTIRANLNDTNTIRGALGVSPLSGRYVYENSQGGTPRIVIFDTVSRTVTSIPTATLGVADFQALIAMSPDGKYMVLAGPSGELMVFDVYTNPLSPALLATVTGYVPPSYQPTNFLSFRVMGNHLYAVDPYQNLFEVFHFNPGSGDFSYINYLAVPGHPTEFFAGLAITPDDALAYMTLYEDDIVAVIDTAKLVSSSTQGDPSALVMQVGSGTGPAVAAVSPRRLDGMQVDMQVAITHTPEPVQPGADITYHLTVTNGGQNFTGTPTGGTGFAVRLDPSLTLVSTTFSAMPNYTCDVSGPALLCQGPALGMGQSVMGDIVAQTSTAGTITSYGYVGGDTYDPNLANNTAVETADVASADMAIAITPSASVVGPGNNLSYTIVATNHGPSPATGVTVVDTIPANVIFVSAPGCTGTATVTCSLGTLAPNTSATVVITVTATSTGTIVNTATVSANESDPNLNNNSATVYTNSNAADLALAAATGSAGAYAVTLTNNGPNAASNVVLTDTLQNFGYLSSSAVVTPVSASPYSVPCTYAASSVSCPIGALNMGDVVNLTVTVKAPSSGWASNSFRATASEPDPNPVNNAVRVGPSSDGNNTQAGANVGVLADDPADGLSAALTFTSVTRSGNTAVKPTSVPALPAGYRNGRQPLIFDISTTAQFGGAIAVALRFPASNFRHPAKVRLFHLENNVWVDATLTLNAAAGAISGAVHSLSPFALLEPLDQVPVANGGPDVAFSGTSSAGAAVKLDGSASADGDGDALTYRWSGPFPEGGGTVAGVNPNVTLPIGVSKVMLVVNDGELDSPAVAVNVSVADFTLSAPAAAMTVQRGGSATYTLTAGSQFGAFGNAVNLACASGSPLVTCSLAPATLTPGAGGATATLTVTAATKSAMTRTGGRSLLAFWLGGLPVFGVVWLGAKSRKRRLAMLLVLLAVLIAAHTGCGGGGNSFSQPQQTSSTSQSVTVTITGTSGTLSHSSAVTVVVQQ